MFAYAQPGASRPAGIVARVFASLSALALASLAPAQSEAVFPTGAPVWNVKNYGAVGDGVADDTAAFKSAISAALGGPSRYSAIRIIYVPNGTYKITDTLQNRVLPTGSWDGNDRWRAGFDLQGQSQAGTILKLPDNAPGFTNAGLPKAVIHTGSEDPQLAPAPRITSLTRSGTTATAVSANHNLGTGMQVSITGAGQTAYNGVKTVTVLDAHTFTFTVSGSPGTPATGTVRFARLLGSLTRAGSIATVLYPNHGFTTGTQLVVNGAAQTAYNGGKYITVVDADTFTYPVSGSPATPATGTITLSTYKPGDFNEAFRHYIRNLTVDVGSGNPGAIGIDFLCSNRGGIYDVTVRSSDANRLGHTGLAMSREWPGPAFIRDLTISGFETGISMLHHAQYGMTLEHVTLLNQRAVGIALQKNTLTARRLTSVNSVPVLDISATAGHATLIDSAFSGGASGGTAITSLGKLYLRNVSSSGYSTVVNDQSPNNRDLAGGSGSTAVDEYFSHGVYETHASIDASIRLPVEETPEFNSTTLSQWRDVRAATVVDGQTQAGATPDHVNNGDDDLRGIQNAINSGLPVVYLPVGNYEISDTLVVSGNVRKIVGLRAGLSKRSDFPAGAPLIRFTGTGAAATIIQGIRINGDLEHDSARTLVVANSDFDAYRNTASGTGRIFFEDVIGETVDLLHPQPLWARQINLELHSTFNGSYIVNHGGRVWLLGYKTEGTNPTLLTNHNGWAELLGGYFLPNNGSPTAMMLVNDNGKLSANYKVGELHNTNYITHVEDTRGSTTYTFTPPADADYRNVTLYSRASGQYPERQAEDTPVLSGVSFDALNAGYTGAGYVDFGGNGSYAEWRNIVVPAAGAYTLVIRYSAAGGGRPCALSVNGASAGNLAFAATANWTTWTTESRTVTFQAGANTVRITASTAAGGPNIDCLAR